MFANYLFNHSSMQTAILSPYLEYQSYIIDCIRPFKFISFQGAFKNTEELLANKNIREVDLFIINTSDELEWLEEIMQLGIRQSTQFLLITEKEELLITNSNIYTLNTTFSSTDFIEVISTLYKKHMTEQAGTTSTLSNQKQVYPDYFFVKNGTKHYKLFFRDILYFEKEGNYFTIHLKDSKKVMSRQNFSTLIQKLPSHQFIRIHISYIVSLHHIDYVNGNVVSVSNQHIPVSNKYKQDLQDLIER